MTLEKELSLAAKLKEWKKDLSPEELKSVINQIEDPVNKLIAKKILFEKE